MILIKSGLSLLLCVFAQGKEKRDLGFNGLGSYHGGNDGPSSSTYPAGESQQNTIDRQGKVDVPAYSNGLINFASTGNEGKNGVYDNTGNSANIVTTIPGNQINNPILMPNFNLQTNTNPGIHFNNPGYVPPNNGLTYGQPNLVGPVAQPVIPVHEQPQIVSQMGHVGYSGVNPIGMQDFRSAQFLPAASPFLQDATVGIRFLPSNTHGAYGPGQGVTYLPVENRQFHAGNFIGGFQGNQPAFNQYIPPMPIMNNIGQNPIVQNLPAFNGQGVNNFPIGPFPVNPSFAGPINFPVGDFSTDNIPNDFYGNNQEDTGTTPEINPETTSTQDTGDVPNDSYPPQNSYNNGESFDGNDNSGNGQSSSQPNTDVSTDYQDNYNTHSGETSKNYYEINHPSYRTSQEVPGDSVGSYVRSDSSQNHDASDEQKYGSTNEQRSSHALEAPKGKLNSGKGRSGKSSLVTNGHAIGNRDSGQRATSYQSFVIHNSKPKRIFTNKISHKPFGGVFGHSEKNDSSDDH